MGFIKRLRSIAEVMHIGQATVHELDTVQRGGTVGIAGYDHVHVQQKYAEEPRWREDYFFDDTYGAYYYVNPEDMPVVDRKEGDKAAKSDKHDEDEATDG
jgi:hypothetical protein